MLFRDKDGLGKLAVVQADQIAASSVRRVEAALLAHPGILAHDAPPHPEAGRAGQATFVTKRTVLARVPSSG